jgi:hypothetical protein
MHVPHADVTQLLLYFWRTALVTSALRQLDGAAAVRMLVTFDRILPGLASRFHCAPGAAASACQRSSSTIVAQYKGVALQALHWAPGWAIVPQASVHIICGGSQLVSCGCCCGTCVTHSVHHASRAWMHDAYMMHIWTKAVP